MKRFFLIILSFLSLSAVISAQISLTSANAPKAGTSVRVRSLAEDSLLNFNIGLAGANRIWNYGAFRFDTSAILQTNYVSPSRTIYGNDRRVSGATYGFFNPQQPESITFDSVTAATWWTIGNADSAGLSRLDPIIRNLTFPWTFNSAFRDSFTQVVIDPAGDTFRVLSINSVKCDAHGSITTPVGTFNCLRIVRVVDQKFELFPGFGFSIKVVSNEWWSAQHPQPVFSYTRINADILGTLDSFAIVSSLVQTRVANDEIAKTVLNMYPNPAQSTVNLDIDIIENQRVALTVFNLSGQIVRLDRFEALQGKQQRTIDVSNLPNGVYMVQLAGEKSKNLGLRKIVIQR